MSRFGSLLCFILPMASVFGAPPAFADAPSDDDTVNREPHRVSAALGAFQLVKGDDTGPAFGLGYSYRPVIGFELGVALNYYRAPDEHAWFAGLSLRGFVPLDFADRVELGLTGRLGLLAISSKSGVCCSQIALAPDVRVRLTRSTALQLSPELAIGTTGDHNGPDTEDDVDEIFAQETVWLSVVQTL